MLRYGDKDMISGAVHLLLPGAAAADGGEGSGGKLVLLSEADRKGLWEAMLANRDADGNTVLHHAALTRNEAGVVEALTPHLGEFSSMFSKLNNNDMAPADTAFSRGLEALGVALAAP